MKRTKPQTKDTNNLTQTETPKPTDFAAILMQLHTSPVIHAQSNPINHISTTRTKPQNKKQKRNKNDLETQMQVDAWVKNIIEKAYDNHPKPLSTSSEVSITNNSTTTSSTPTQPQDNGNTPKKF